MAMRQWRAVAISAGFVACLVLPLLAARRSAGVSPLTVGARPASATTGGSSATAGPTTTAAPATTSPDAGTTTTERGAAVGDLPQTDTQPTTQSAAFEAGAASLWHAVVTDDPDSALPFFFPEAAYRQVKDIAAPDQDWQNRLVADFRVDVHTLHEQLGSAGSTATFERLDVPDGQAEWIQPGVEYNKGSYWRVYGSRLLYTVDGVERSLPVSSLISWRGEWYVVHLGAIR